MEYLSYIIPLVLSAALGGVVGWQREHIGKKAGSRTYALVCLGSAMFTTLSIHAFGANMAQVASQILTGIGFLGAGTIIHKQGGVDGLTTAAGLWTMAAVGMAVGVGWYWQATASTILMFLILLFRDKEVFRR